QDVPWGSPSTISSIATRTCCGIVLRTMSGIGKEQVMDSSDKVRENRLRRVAERRGWTLSKSRRRDPLALDYGEYVLVASSMRVGNADIPLRRVSLSSLDEVEDFLNAKFGPR